MKELIDLQITIFALILIGLWIRKKGMVGAQGQKNITDLVINIVLPCNIIKAFMIEFSGKMLMDFAEILLVSIFLQAASVVLGKILYKKAELKRRQCLRYGIICSNAGFMGNPLSEGVFGSTGLMLASIFLIPQRIMMWSEGVAIFTEAPDQKSLVLKVLKHPCIIACEIGVILMVTGLRPPSGILATITALSNCNTALSMLVIGMILAGADPRTLLDKDILSYCALRLVLMPLVLFGALKLLNVSQMVCGVSVLLAAMPAGATTSILASKYGGDDEFAVKLVVMSTALSLLTTPIWSALLK